MQVAALRHTEMTEELAIFKSGVSSTTESVLGRLPGNTSLMEIVG
jgi:hypothetical protein